MMFSRKIAAMKAPMAMSAAICFPVVGVAPGSN